MIKPVRSSLTEFVATLTPQLLATIADGMTDSGVVRLPRLTSVSTTDLEEPLQALGMTDAFSTRADLSGITTDANLKVDRVRQRVYVSVDEQGTVAAALTGGSTIAQSRRPPPLTVTFDRPFLFLVRDTKTGAILFATQVQNPAEG